MERETSYRTLKAIAALNEKFALGEIDREQYDKMHKSLAEPPQAPAEQRHTGLFKAVESYVKAVYDNLDARMKSVEDRIGALEQKAAAPESKAEAGDRWLKAV